VIDPPAPGSGSTSAIGDLNVAFVLVGAADATILPFIPLYLFERGFSAPAIGIVLAAAAMASFVAGPTWAYLADSWLGLENTVVLASSIGAAVPLLLAIANTTIAVAVVTVAFWVARAPVISLLDAIALQRLRTASRVGYARIRLRMSAGWAASVVLSGGLFQVAGLRLIPFVYAPMALLAGLWVWHVRTRGVALRRVEPAPSLPPVRRLNPVPMALIGFLVSALLLGSAFAATSNFVTLRINLLGGGALLVGAASAFQALTEVPTMAYTHVLLRYLSHRMLYVAGAGVSLLVFVGWALVSDALATALLKLVLGVGFALTYVGAVLIADDVAPPHLRATAQALVKAVSGGLAPVVGALGGGIIFGGFGSGAMFVAAAAVTAGAGVMAVIALPARSLRPSPNPGS
jgi:MFS transporter, PPP family, 3-phenylpropionic acid transporter